MLVEVESAANFLSDLLSRSQRVSQKQLQAFRQSIITCLVNSYQKHWFPEQPFKGSAFRCLRINHKMDPLVFRAAEECGLQRELEILPNELTLWVDPKEVSYRIGENGSICVIYEDSPHSSPNSSHSSSPVQSWLGSNVTTRVCLNSFLS